MTSRPLAVGIDLGSTTIKAGVLDAGGRLADLRSVPAPELCGEDPVREGDPDRYADAATGLLRTVAERVPHGTPLGLATQRSTFTLWERGDGRARFPLISWQDRRAAAWCDRHRSIEPEVVRRTGLLLSAHYIGPKLAAMREADDSFSAAMRSGRFALGTLETYLTRQWSARRRHDTDLTVAARSALVDIQRESWSPELLRHFGVPSDLLPEIVPTTGRDLALDCGLRLDVTLSDQAAAALPVLDPARRTALVNLGTGAFVLVPTSRPGLRKPGYLLGPTLATARGERRYALEGTVNGAGPAVDRFAPGPTDLPEADPCPAGFAVPDLSGLGSPWWRPAVGLRLSPAAERLDRAARRRVVLEGVLFRVREILDALADPPPERIIVAGGLTRDPAVGPGLAALCGTHVELLEERESGLLGAARLAAGLEPYADPPTLVIEPGPPGAYLRDKYAAWTRWFTDLLAGSD